MRKSVRGRSVLSLLALTIGCGTAAPVGTTEPPPLAAPTPDPPTATCGADRTPCTAGRCSLSIGPTALPTGAKVLLREIARPKELEADAIASAMCEILAPSGIASPLGLSIRAEEVLPSGATAFRTQDGSAAATPSTVRGDVTETLADRPGVYGVTSARGTARVERVIGSLSTGSATPAAYLRNVSSRGIEAAFFDGTRLYVGNGGRVLVFDGIPEDPLAKPRVVLGEPDLDTPSSGVSASAFGASVGAIWSDGKKLAVAAGNRILVWSAIPEVSFTPADLVLGQSDFSSQEPNAGGVSARSLYLPRALDSDGTRVVVADTYNNRVLMWDAFPRASGEAASRVIGQASFTSAAPYASRLPIYIAAGAALTDNGLFVTSTWTSSGASHVATGGPRTNVGADFQLLDAAPQIVPDRLYTPASVFRTPSGGLGVVDASGLRIAMFRGLPQAKAPQMDFVLGLPDATRYLWDETTTASSLRGAQTASISSAAHKLVVPDGGRLLVWDEPPSYTYEPASRVFGQPGFTTNTLGVDYTGISASTLAAPVDVAASAHGVAVADRGNNRVTIYPVGVSGAGAAAKVVLGQPDAFSFVANKDQRSPSAARLSGPVAVTFAGERVVVVDAENHRVLVWNKIPTVSGAPADLVLGQRDFEGRRPNRGRGDVAPLDGFSDVDGDGFFYPSGVASDGTRLFVADRANNRVLVWRSFPTTNGQAADAVIGQSSLTRFAPNAGAGAYQPSPSGFNLPSRLALSGETLWVADTENNRVVKIEEAGTAPRPTAFLGQPDGATITNALVYGEGTGATGYPIAIPAPSRGSVIRPQGLAVVGGRVYVSEADASRVQVFDESTLAPVAVLGQADFADGLPNAGGRGARTLAAPLGLASDGLRLFVADTDNHRVLGYEVGSPVATHGAAVSVLGQGSFGAGAFNRSPGSGSTRPRALAKWGGELFVAESDRHRVVVLSPGGAAGAYTRILGQPDASSALPNAGNTPSATSLSDPRGVSVDEDHVVVADAGNNRVLVFDRRSTRPDASLVLGQTDYSSAAVNRGGAAGAATLHAPGAVFTDGRRLFVADTGNHRVLVWRTFPTYNGQPADAVIGQASMSGRFGNRGGAASPRTLALPLGLDVVGDALYVSDSGNNRLLEFAAEPPAADAAARVVVGQPDATSRAPAVKSDDRGRLSGPAAVSHDGTFLYVADRDLGRVLAFPLPLRAGAAAEVVLGADGRTSLGGCAGVVAERTAGFTTRVFATDTHGGRIVVFGGVSRLR